MSDPSESTQANPHPVSQHRSPREIAADEAGPIGQPDLDVVAKEVSNSTAREYPAEERALRAVESKKRRKRR
ncbi:MAG TPA: hypothetical protein VF850_06695 [Gemmatimonadaceae bacterium]